MRDASTVQIAQSTYQIPQEAIELLNVPIPAIGPPVLDNLRKTSIDPLHYQHMIVGVINAVNPSMDHVVIIHIQ